MGVYSSTCGCTGTEQSGLWLTVVFFSTCGRRQVELGLSVLAMWKEIECIYIC